MKVIKKIREALFALVLAGFPLVTLGQGIENPLKRNATIVDLIVNFTNFLLSLVVILSLLGSVWAGVRMILSVGNESGVAESKKILFWSIAGLVVASLSYVIIRLVARDILGIQGA